jgi:MFS family permease
MHPLEPTTEPAEPNDSQPVYNSSLLFAFLANVFQLISIGLLYRYSDFVTIAGGGEFDLGLITGLATIGAILFRVVQGVSIDRIGPQKIWLFCLALQFVALCWHLSVDNVDGMQVYLARGVLATGIAGSFGSWLSFVSLQAPEHRVAEVIGVVGASGFVGMAIGPAIGDWIFAGGPVTRAKVEWMFQFSAAMIACGFISTVIAIGLGKSVQHGGRKTNQPFRNPLNLVRRQNPGFILVVGMLMGMTIGFPGIFLRPLAESLNIEGIKVFFLVYNITAFVSRLLFRRAPEFLGLNRTIVVGYLFFLGSLLLFMRAETEAGFWMPALLGGLGHSFLFPSVIAKCTSQFAKEDRGVAASLILAMYDMGVLFGMPMIGKIIADADQYGWPSYPSALTVMCVCIVLGVGTFLVLENRRVDLDRDRESAAK